MSTPNDDDRIRAHDASTTAERIAALERELDELRASTVARDEFLSIVAHELRNPVSPIYMQVQTMMLKLRDDPAAIDAEWLRPRLDGFAERLDRFLAALDRILDLAHISTGRLQLHPEPLQHHEIVAQSVEWHVREAAAAGCELRLALGADVRGVWDRLRVQQVCSNLLSNAIRYGAGSPIEIRTRALDGSVEISVRDHGPGIAYEDRQRIFERFERASAIRGGLGVGLWLVERLCAAMGGTIAVDSKLGEGSTFIARLPRSPR
ncbi:MAG TPA: HAMP domain-containing sensor histidine kinase [Nannocystaceae bacterium]|nr:HAMP domain-containing sensor histidine kinase [Nannocystaceae bacterium]